MQSTHASPGALERGLSRLVVLAALAAVAPLQAQRPALHVDPAVDDCSVQFASTLTQTAFRRFAREFGSVSAFKQMGPASTLARGRVAIGVEMMRFTIDEWSDAWNDTFAHPDADHPLGSRKTFPKLKVRAGVSDRMDVGAFYTRNAQANYGWLGIDGKYRVLTQGERTPVTVAARAAYTKTLYVSDMDMHALTADVSVERRAWDVFRPYVGLGADGVIARETGDAVSLRTEKAIAPHLLAGFDVLAWRRMSLGAELTVGARTSAQVQVAGLVF